MIRKAAIEDLDRIRAIARAAYAVYVPRIGREPAPMVADFTAQIAAGQVWIDADGRGFVVAYPRGGHWHLENVAVAPDARGLGIGRGLIAHVEALAEAAGAPAVELYTNAAMTENQSLYPRLGYREIRRAREDGFDRIFYRKHLDAPAA